MQIHSLKISSRKKRRKTIGRGGRKGTYSGRGSKGQKARSGAKVKPLFEGGRSTLIDHMKKARGFKSPHSKRIIVKFEKLAGKFETGEKITSEKLIQAGLLKLKDAKKKIKIIGTRSAKKQFSFDKDILASQIKYASKNKSNL